MAEYVHFADRREQTVQVENMAVTVFMNAVLPRVLSAEQERWAKMMLHEHAHWEIFGGIPGGLFVQFTDVALTLDPGDVLLIRPHVQHMSIVLDGQSERISVPFYFQHKSVPCRYDLFSRVDALVGPGPWLLLHDKPDICRMLNATMEAGTSLPPPCACVKMVEILLELCGQSMQSAGDILENSDIGRLEKLDQICSEYFMVPMTVEYVAEKLFISVRQLERIVKDRYGATFREIITARRMRAAEQLLRHTDQSIAEIAEHVGYTSKESFLSAFRTHKGMTPTAYRKLGMEQDAKDKRYGLPESGDSAQNASILNGEDMAK